MPVAKIHVTEGQYDEARLTSVSTAVQDSLMNVLGVPPDDFFQIIHVLPRKHFLHTPSFVGMNYSDDLIILEITFISGRPRVNRAAVGRGGCHSPSKLAFSSWRDAALQFSCDTDARCAKPWPNETFSPGTS